MEKIPLYSTAKMTIAGSQVFFALTTRPVEFGFKARKINPRTHDEISDEDRKKNKKLSAYHAQSRIKELITANSWQWHDNGKVFNPLFVTLTYKGNVTDLDRSFKDFNKFVKRFSYHVSKTYMDRRAYKLKYVGVPEFQKRGAIHFHVVMFNVPFLHQLSEIDQIWSFGRCNTEAVKTIQQVAVYLTKYLVKNFKDNDRFYRRRYLSAKGLHRPFKTRHENVVRGVLSEIPDDKLVYRNVYKYKIRGGKEQEVLYMDFDFGKGVDLRKDPMFQRLLN